MQAEHKNEVHATESEQHDATFRLRSALSTSAVRSAAFTHTLHLALTFRLEERRERMAEQRTAPRRAPLTAVGNNSVPAPGSKRAPPPVAPRRRAPRPGDAECRDLVRLSPLHEDRGKQWSTR